MGDLDTNDLEISVKILEWLVLKGIVCTKNLRYKHIGLFRDNMAAVSSAQREVERESASSGRIIIVLALRQQVARASPLVVALVKGDLNVLGGIPSRLFANKTKTLTIRPDDAELFSTPLCVNDTAAVVSLKRPMCL